MTEPEPIRIALDASDFFALVSGEIVRADAPGSVARARVVEIILSDIGWDEMERAIDAARKAGA